MRPAAFITGSVGLFFAHKPPWLATSFLVESCYSLNLPEVWLQDGQFFSLVVVCILVFRRSLFTTGSHDLKFVWSAVQFAS